MIQYEFDETQGLSATDFMYIRVGFTTKKKQGILMQLRDAGNKEYISLELNNNGGVKFFLDVGFERWELNTDINNIDLTNGQAHEVILRRENNGKDVYLQVSGLLFIAYKCLLCYLRNPDGATQNLACLDMGCSEILPHSLLSLN